MEVGQGRTRRLLCEKMMELLREKPFLRITVQDILDRAGVQRATFYRHFHDKYEVVELINHDLTEYLITAYRDACWGGQRERLGQVTEAVSKHRETLRCLAELHVERVHLLTDMHNRFEAEYRENCPGCGDFEAFLAAENFVSGLVWILKNDVPHACVTIEAQMDAQLRILASESGTTPELLRAVIGGEAMTGPSVSGIQP